MTPEDMDEFIEFCEAQAQFWSHAKLRNPKPENYVKWEKRKMFLQAIKKQIFPETVKD